MRIGRWRPRVGRASGYALVFFVLTAVMTWPLILHAGSAVQDLGDPLYEIWTMRWVQHEILRDPVNLWNGNTAYPFRLSLLFSEPRLSTSLLAWPLQILTGNDVLVYNLMFLSSFVLLGLGMALLVAELSGSTGAGLLAGVFAAYTPYRYGHLSHLNLLSYGWLPLALWALVRYRRARRPGYAALAAVFLTIQLLASDTLALMSLVVVGLALVFLIWPERAGAVAGGDAGQEPPRYPAKPTEEAEDAGTAPTPSKPGLFSGLRRVARSYNPARGLRRARARAPEDPPGLANDSAADMSSNPAPVAPSNLPRRLAFVAGFVAALAIPLLAFSPVILGRLEVNRVYGFTRDLQTIRDMSAHLASYASVAPGNHLWRGRLPVAYPNPLFPGGVALAGMLLALLLAPWRRSRWVLFALVVTLGGVILSLGPETTIGASTVTLPYGWLYAHVPGFNTMRDVARFGMLALLGAQMLAGLGFAAAWSLLRPRLAARVAPGVAALLTIALATAGVLEYRDQVRAVAVPRDQATVAAYDWLATQPRGAVYELPGNGLWADLGQTIRQIYFSTRHWQPIVAGYTSFLPERYIDLLTGINGGIDKPSRIDATNVGVLQNLGIRYLLIHHVDSRGYDWRRAIALADRLPELTRAGDLGATTVYLVRPGHREPLGFDLLAPNAALAGGVVPITLRIANANRYDALTTLDTPPPLTATWIDARGAEVLSTSIPLDLPVVIHGGDTIRLVWSAAPRKAGTYRLRLSYGSLAPGSEVSVDVRPAQPLATGGPWVALRGLTQPTSPVRSGDTLRVTTFWGVQRRPALDYAVTIQLIDQQRRVAAQWDGQPFAGAFPTSRWPPGMQLALPLALHIPDRLAPGRYTLLIALYDGRTPRQRRVEITLPNGTVKPEFEFGPVVVNAP